MLYLLLMSPFFISPAPHTGLVMHDGTCAQGYPEIACNLLTFLMSGTHPSLSVSNSQYLDQDSALLRTLVIHIIAVALAHSTYSTILIFQLTQFLGAVRHTKRINGDKFLVLSFQQLAPIIVSHCIVCLGSFIISPPKGTDQLLSVCSQRLHYRWTSPSS